MRVLLVALALGLGAVPAAAQSPEEEVLGVVRRLFDGMRARDTARMRAQLHPDARLVSAGQRNGVPSVEVETPAGWLAAVAGAADVPDERTGNPVVKVDGGLASVWMEYRFYIGTRFSHCGVDTFHLVRTADGWRIIDLADTRRREGCSP
jgi:hypothetical protein